MSEIRYTRATTNSGRSFFVAHRNEQVLGFGYFVHRGEDKVVVGWHQDYSQDDLPTEIDPAAIHYVKVNV